MGFFSFETAWRTLQGFEMMNMIRKGQLQEVGKGDVRGQMAFVANLFGVAISHEPEGNSITLLISSSFLQHNLQQCPQA
ncbi:hypothetical protein KSF_075900 [Reticulibacter mediterranei]|uniref:Uncharacterized protein n=1 Tax=Reticulibacter mediterranei TaxID=2778369 RepID=A0A8J3IVJ4_9CHLR|nr:hypothetical protein KSF_075900 [Reticulibacter mediterranei]